MFVLDTEALSSCDLARIGKVVVTFSELELELLCAFQSLQEFVDGEVESEGAALNHLMKVHDVSLAGRVAHFVVIYKRAFGDDAGIAAFERQCVEGLKLRNSFAHGVWQKIDDNQIKLTFFSKNAVKDGYPNFEFVWSAILLEQLAKANQEMTCWLRALQHETRITVSK